MRRSLRVLAVCTHNRTRSVLMGALIEEHGRRAGRPIAVATAASLGDPGLAPTPETVRFLGRYGVDVSSHRSRRLDDVDATRADLVVTAEQDHVVAVVGRWPTLYPRTFTLPELVELGRAVGGATGGDLSAWLDAIDERRPGPLDYLDHQVGEIDDPTGESPAAWTAAIATIDRLTADLVGMLP